MPPLRSIWLNAWDLDVVPPRELAARLKDLGLNACNVGFSYHGGRMLLPRHAARRVYEQHDSALYFDSDPARYQGLALRPHVAPESRLMRPFVDACVAEDLEVNAWTVLCHNDRLGAAAPQCCVVNAYGDVYSYALCPSNRDVRRYVAALCADVAAVEGVARLDLEALGFMGVEHNSLHDKRGVPLTPAISWLLSICLCPACAELMGAPQAREIKRRARMKVDEYLETWPTRGRVDLREELDDALGGELLNHLLATRRQVLRSLLGEIRSAVGAAHINLRAASSPLFVGGKTPLPVSDVSALVDSVTYTFFGAPLDAVSAEVARWPPRAERGTSYYGGFVFHHPDCAAEADVAERVAMLRAAHADGLLFYCYSMATTEHLSWLENILHAE